MTDFGERRRELPKTGQIISYRDGDDGYYQKGWRNGERFKVVGDGTIIDNATGLMWPQDTNSPPGNNNQALTWNNAIDYAEALVWKGFNNWRMPNAREFRTLLDYGTAPFQINLIIQYPSAGLYWTSTTEPGDAALAFLWYYPWKTFRLMLKIVTAHFFCCRDA